MNSQALRRASSIVFVVGMFGLAFGDEASVISPDQTLASTNHSRLPAG